MIARHEEARQRITTCLDWGTRALRTGKGAEALWETDNSELIQPFEKMLTEAGLFALIAHRAIGDDPAVSDLLDAITDCSDELDHIYELVRWRPYLWTSAGAIWVILDHFSMGDATKRARLRGLWEKETIPHPRERVPYRLLDQAWLRTIAQGRRDPRLSSSGLRSCTSFENIEGSLFMGTSDLYALTHTAMYVTDFGALGRVPIAEGWVHALGASRLLLNDLDLAAELALTDVLTRAEPEVGTLAVVSVLNSLFDQIGCVPAPTFRADEHSAAEDPEAYLLFHSYHSTFVYGLLCSVLLTLKVNQDPLARLMSGAISTHFPEEWCGRRAGLTGLSDQIVHTFTAWKKISADRGISLDDDALLRVVVDSYLINAVGEEKVEDVVSLLGMRGVAGESSVDGAARKMLIVRARLGGNTSLPEVLGR